MSVLQRRIELRPHMVAWMQSALCLLLAVVLSGDPTGFAQSVCFLFAVLFAVGAWNRCGNVIPIFGMGLFFGSLLEPIIYTERHSMYSTLAGYAGLVAGGIMGVAIGVFADFVEAEDRVYRVREANHDVATEGVRLEDSANPTNENP